MMNETILFMLGTILIMFVLSIIFDIVDRVILKKKLTVTFD